MRGRRAAVVLLVLLALGSLSPPAHASATGARWISQLPGVTPSGGPRDVALTFDDSPDPWATPQVLQILRTYGVPGTWFVPGASAAAAPGLIESIARDGHVVAGHGWTHTSLTGLSDGEIASALARTDAVLRDLTGQTAPCVRPPNGAISDRVVGDLARAGKTTVMWSVDPWDWSGPGVSAIVSRVLGAVRPGAVVLLHPGSGVRAQTVAALPAIITGLQARGYRFVSMCGSAPNVRSLVTGEAYGPGPAPWPGTPLVSNTMPVAAAPTPSAHGAWVAAADGGVFAFGDARFLGSLGSLHLNAPIIGMAPTPTGAGYWLTAADGGVFAFGDAPFFGSLGSFHLNAPIVGGMATASGRGYWLIAADGGVFAFGDASFLGSLGSFHLNAPIVGMAPTPTGAGYWLVASDGGVFTFGDAPFFGSLGGAAVPSPVVGMAATPTGHGYWLAHDSGGVAAFGDAPAVAPRLRAAAWEHVGAITATTGGVWLVRHQPAVRPL